MILGANSGGLLVSPMSDWFEDHKAMEQRRRERAKGEPIVEVTGIIPPTGVALAQMRGGPAEEVVTFYTWRIGRGPLEPRELRLVQEEIGGRLPLGSLRTLSPGTVITTKARVFWSDDGVFGIVAGQARGVTPDTAMAQALERLKAPDTFDDPQLGRLTADPLLGWAGEARWLGGACTLSIERRDELPTAHALWADQQRWTKDAVQVAATSLLDLKNTSWLDEGQSPVTATEFQAKLKLISIAIEKGGGFVLEFDDGDLFWGHTILVDGNLRDGLIEANLAG
jgi:hypothetical protein